MADGTRKPIEEVKVGDKVLATDPTTGKTTAQPVTDTIVGSGRKNLVRIIVDTDGAKGSMTGVVIATDGHPFWTVRDKQWHTAGDLKPGMWLRTSAGTHVQVTAVKARTVYQRVYNLTVDTDHTYYELAGDATLLVHNCEVYYRTMSQEHFETLSNTGRLPATRETFITQSKKYAQRYDGVTVEFRVAEGTMSNLEEIGVRHASRATAEAYPDMPVVSGRWRQVAALFKSEKEFMNIGLGGGRALDIFNDAILGFDRVP
jgi:hypothetical protein